MKTYLNNDQLPFPYCPGCGHSTILKKLDEALVALNLDPKKVVIVTDIGCAGLGDRFFITNTFSDITCFTKTINTFGRFTLHTSQTFCFFYFRAIQSCQYPSENFIIISVGDIYTADSAIKSAG